MYENNIYDKLSENVAKSTGELVFIRFTVIELVCFVVEICRLFFFGRKMKIKNRHRIKLWCCCVKIYGLLSMKLTPKVTWRVWISVITTPKNSLIKIYCRLKEETPQNSFESHTHISFRPLQHFYIHIENERVKLKLVAVASVQNRICARIYFCHFNWLCVFLWSSFVGLLYKYALCLSFTFVLLKLKKKNDEKRQQQPSTSTRCNPLITLNKNCVA